MSAEWVGKVKKAMEQGPEGSDVDGQSELSAQDQSDWDDNDYHGAKSMYHVTASDADTLCAASFPT